MNSSLIRAYRAERLKMWKSLCQYSGTIHGKTHAQDSLRDAHTRLEWRALECGEHDLPELGSVRLNIVPDEFADFEDLCGDCFNRAGMGNHVSERTIQEQLRRFENTVNDNGVWGVIGEYWNGATWEQVDSCFGFVGDDWKESGYDIDIMRATLDAANLAIENGPSEGEDASLEGAA